MPVLRIEGYPVDPRKFQHFRETPMFRILRNLLSPLPFSDHINITVGSGHSVDIHGDDDPYIVVSTMGDQHRAELLPALKPLGFDLETGDLAGYLLGDPELKAATKNFLRWSSQYGSEARLSLAKLRVPLQNKPAGTYVGCLHTVNSEEDDYLVTAYEIGLGGGMGAAIRVHRPEVLEVLYSNFN